MMREQGIRAEGAEGAEGVEEEFTLPQRCLSVAEASPPLFTTQIGLLYWAAYVLIGNWI